MDDVPAVSDAATRSLYEDDFYAWTQQQATLLRSGRVANIDVANILEEIESLGRKEVAELRSRYIVLATHLLKRMYQPERSSRSWATTILNQRIEIALHIEDNPGLKPKADEIFARAYAAARQMAASETGLALTTFPTQSPFSREEVVDTAWSPHTEA